MQETRTETYLSLGKQRGRAGTAGAPQDRACQPIRRVSCRGHSVRTEPTGRGCRGQPGRWRGWPLLPAPPSGVLRLWAGPRHPALSACTGSCDRRREKCPWSLAPRTPRDPMVVSASPWGPTLPRGLRSAPHPVYVGGLAPRHPHRCPVIPWPGHRAQCACFPTATLPSREAVPLGSCLPGGPRSPSGHGHGHRVPHSSHLPRPAHGKYSGGAAASQALGLEGAREAVVNTRRPGDDSP